MPVNPNYTPNRAVGVLANKIGLYAGVGVGTNLDTVANRGVAATWADTANVASPGNMMLFGHRTTHGGIFRYINSLKPGDTFAMAGLFQHDYQNNTSQTPWLGDVPVLGALFRSRDFQNDETELVVIVTPYLVDPTDPQGFRDPDRGYVTSTDARTILFGKLNDVYAVPGSASAKTPAPKGASGFIID